uniref:ATP synthase complex subunit 8 n=1 Tax=Jamesia sp. KM-2017 TaxID=2219643 RepID=A0A346RFD1_9CUCU|nr:ATP synthase F0 subunit 8 [Jamesia sp. KM-2017]
MPQMAPLNWLTLFIYFIFIFILFNIHNYFFINYTFKSSTKEKKYFKFNWLW